MNNQIVFDMPEPEYRSAPGRNQSWLRRLLWQNWDRADTPIPQNINMKIGVYSHCAILEPERFEREYVKGLDHQRRTRKHRKRWSDFEYKHRGKTILKSELYRKIISIRDAAWKHPDLSTLLKEGNPEVSIFWTEPHTGVNCKGRLDWVNPTTSQIIDLKTIDKLDEHVTQSSLPPSFCFQSAFYKDGIDLLSDTNFEFIFAFIERQGEHRIHLTKVSAESFESGRNYYIQSLEKLKKEENNH